MANLTSGINTFNTDKDSNSGIESVWLTSQSNIAALTYSNGVATTFTGATTSMYYQFKPRKYTSSFGSKINVNAQNGTSFYTTNINLQFDKLDVTKRNIVSILSKGTFNAIVKTANGDYWMAENLDLTESSFESASNTGEFAGYKLSLTTNDTKDILCVTASLVNTLGLS